MVSAATLTLDLVGSKLRPPWSRAGLVVRTALVEQLLATDAPVIAIVAPPGFEEHVKTGAIRRAEDIGLLSR